MSAFWTFLAAVDRDWSRALTPALCLLGFSLHLLLNRLRRPNAATAVVVVTVASVFVVSIVRGAWLVAVVMGLGLLGMVAIGVFALRARSTG